jgi:urease accessory protein
VSAASGLLSLRFACSDGVSRLVERRQRFPLRLTVPLYLDPNEPGMAFIYVQNPTGGVFPGDELTIDVTAGEATAVHLTAPAATKVYRGEGASASVDIVVRLGPDAYLEHVPELLISFAGSRYVQNLRVELSRGSSFVGVECLAPGRFARGEAFAYELVELRTAAYSVEGSELCVDRLVLEPARIPPLRRGLLGAHPFLGTILVLAPDRDAEAVSVALDDAVSGLGAAAPLPFGAGAIARVLAPSSAALRSTVEAGWAAARQLLLGSQLPPWRK